MLLIDNIITIYKYCLGYDGYKNIEYEIIPDDNEILCRCDLCNNYDRFIAININKFMAIFIKRLLCKND